MDKQNKDATAEQIAEKLFPESPIKDLRKVVLRLGYERLANKLSKIQKEYGISKVSQLLALDDETIQQYAVECNIIPKDLQRLHNTLSSKCSEIPHWNCPGTSLEGSDLLKIPPYPSTGAYEKLFPESPVEHLRTVIARLNYAVLKEKLSKIQKEYGISKVSQLLALDDETIQKYAVECNIFPLDIQRLHEVLSSKCSEPKWRCPEYTPKKNEGRPTFPIKDKDSLDTIVKRMWSRSDRDVRTMGFAFAKKRDAATISAKEFFGPRFPDEHPEWTDEQKVKLYKFLVQRSFTPEWESIKKIVEDDRNGFSERADGKDWSNTLGERDDKGII